MNVPAPAFGLLALPKCNKRRTLRRLSSKGYLLCPDFVFALLQAATGGEPGPGDDQQEPHDGGQVEWFTEQEDAEEDGDDGVDVSKDGASASPNFGQQREEGQIG